MVYFVQLQSGAVKIGHTANLDQRLNGLSSYYGCMPVVLGTMPGDAATEREIHTRFAHLRLGRKEQFQPARDLMDFIGHPLMVSPNPDAIDATPPNPNCRRPASFRLSEEAEAIMKEAKDRLGLSRTAAIEMGLRTLHAHHLAEPKRPRKPPTASP